MQLSFQAARRRLLQSVDDSQLGVAVKGHQNDLVAGQNDRNLLDFRNADLNVVGLLKDEALNPHCVKASIQFLQEGTRVAQHVLSLFHERIPQVLHALPWIFFDRYLLVRLLLLLRLLIQLNQEERFAVDFVDGVLYRFKRFFAQAYHF